MPFVHRQAHSLQERNKSCQKIKKEQEQSFYLDSERGNVDGSNENDVNEGRWSDQENLKFILFVSYYQSIFASKYKRKNSKIFKLFAEYMTQRTSAQCRSHFQKLLVKFKTVAKIKKHYVKLHGTQQFNALFFQFKQEWERCQKQVRMNKVKEIGVQTEQILVKKEVILDNSQLCNYPFWSALKLEGCPYPYLLSYNTTI